MHDHRSRHGRRVLRRLAALALPAALVLMAGAAPVAQSAPACADQALPCNLTDGLDDARELKP